MLRTYYKRLCLLNCNLMVLYTIPTFLMDYIHETQQAFRRSLETLVGSSKEGNLLSSTPSAPEMMTPRRTSKRTTDGNVTTNWAYLETSIKEHYHNNSVYNLISFFLSCIFICMYICSQNILEIHALALKK